MNLYILRHAIAVERGTHGYTDDSKRPLTPEGEGKMIKGAQGMKALGLRFDTIYASPYVRAKATAGIVADTFGIDPRLIQITANLTPEAPFEELLHELQDHSNRDKNLLLVGHEPHLSGLISFLLTGDTQLRIDFKKGGLCALMCPRRAAPGSATLQWLLTPAQLRSYL